MKTWLYSPEEVTAKCNELEYENRSLRAQLAQLQDEYDDMFLEWRGIDTAQGDLVCRECHGCGVIQSNRCTACGGSGCSNRPWGEEAMSQTYLCICKCGAIRAADIAEYRDDEWRKTMRRHLKKPGNTIEVVESSEVSNMSWKCTCDAEQTR